MTQTLTLPSLATIPEDIDEQLHYLIHHAPEIVTGDWLHELIKNSGHLTTPDYLRWRVVALIWLATKFDIDKAWSYLMWFNMNEPVIGDHLSEIVTDGVDELQCHVQLANWLVEADDERLVQFFSGYKNIPSAHKMGGVLRRLIHQARAEPVGVWLAEVCRETADNPSPLMRGWHLLIAAWYATCFDPAAGLDYLRAKSAGSSTLSSEDNQAMTKIAQEINAVPAMIQWIADCDDPAVKTMLQDFGHPDLPAIANAVFANPPDYDHLAEAVPQAAAEVRLFERSRELLTAAGIEPKTARLLFLACGPLAAQPLLFNSAGYTVTGVDVDIPPGYLPPAGIKQRFAKGKYVKAWKAATQRYYQVLGQEAGGLKLSWKKATIALADLTRLQFPDGSFDVVLCCNHLQHAPDVAGLLAEAARVLKPGGLLVADIKPFTALTGDCRTANSAIPWGHLREPYHPPPGTTLNQWREAQYRAALEAHFTIEQWQAESDDQAEARLTSDIKADLLDFSADELTRLEIVVVARNR
ncbi:MAG: methyltransferase domain-containing protein [Anaerolineae bacterium]|nr:methyltransferase domain-containing protein [Anaerolineae bacterium]